MKKIMLMLMAVLLMAGSSMATVHTTLTEGFDAGASNWDWPRTSLDTGYSWSAHSNSVPTADNFGMLTNLGEWSILLGNYSGAFGQNAWTTFGGDSVENLMSFEVTGVAYHPNESGMAYEAIIQDANGDWFVSDDTALVRASEATSIDVRVTTWRTIAIPVIATAIAPGAAGTPDLSSILGGGINFIDGDTFDNAGYQGVGRVTWNGSSGIIVDPTPADKSAITMAGQEITWTVDAFDPNIVSVDAYDVYFSDNEALVIAGDASVRVGSNQVAASYTAGTLDAGSTYYVRVDPNTTVDYSGSPVSFEGIVWEYTIPMVFTTLTEGFETNGSNWDWPRTSIDTGYTWSAHSNQDDLLGMLINEGEWQILLKNISGAFGQNAWTTFGVDSVVNLASINVTGVAYHADASGMAYEAIIQDANGDWFVSDDTALVLASTVTSINATTTTWRTIAAPVIATAIVPGAVGTPDLSSILGGGINFISGDTYGNVGYQGVGTMEWSNMIPIAPVTPADGATDISIVADDLEWNALAGAMSSVRFGTDPNMADPIATGNADILVPTVDTTSVGYGTLDYGTTYYWQVTVDNGVGSVLVSDVMSFTTVTAIPVIAEFDNVRTTRALLPAALSAVVTDADNDLVSIDWLWLSDDVNAPVGAVGTITETNSDLNAPTADFGAPSDPSGVYIIRLTATDGDGNVSERDAEVRVYETACELAIVRGGEFNYYDRDEDCDVDLNDFAVFAAEWLDDINADAQDTVSPGGANYTPTAPE